MTKATEAMIKTIKIFTIGFAKKSAREFFTCLRDAEIQKVVDVRLNNVSQLAGFTKKEDLEYFLRTIGDMGYVHKPDLAPTKDILDAYKKKEINWEEYEIRYRELLRARKAEILVSPEEVNHCCLLCSEPSAEKCHRRLLAEYLRECWSSNVIIHHL
jgi:uncharacterized protein (DUF488 family)